MEWPKISIVTPSLNQGEFLEESIRSVLAQGYPNLEFIIIDGGSTDGSAEIVAKYRDKINYYVSEADNGQSHAVNKGLLRATGDIIGWLNSDDRYVPGAFMHVVKEFQKKPETVAVHGQRVMIDEAGVVCGWTCSSDFEPETGDYTVCSETVFWKRDIMQRIGLLREDLKVAMDLEYFCRIYQYGKMEKIDKYLGCFRCYPRNKTARMYEIGRIETLREWVRMFGTEPAPKVVPTLPEKVAEKVRSLLALLKNPKLLAWPYVIRRFVKRRRGMLLL